MDEINSLASTTAGLVALTIIGALLAQVIVRQLVALFVKHKVKTDHRGKTEDYLKRRDTLVSVFKTFFSVVLWIFVIAIILWELHVNIGAMLTGAGLIGVVLGFGMQSSVKDFLGGIFIISENQYRVSDYIKLQTDAGEVSGTVEDITIRITRLRDMEGILHSVPNGSIIFASNYTIGFANIWLDIAVDYDSDVLQVEKIINQVGEDMLNDSEVCDHIIEPIKFWRVNGFEQSTMLIKVSGKVNPGKQWAVTGEFRKQLKIAFDNNKIDMSSVQVTVHQSSKKVAHNHTKA